MSDKNMRKPDIRYFKKCCSNACENRSSVWTWMGLKTFHSQDSFTVSVLDIGQSILQTPGDRNIPQDSYPFQGDKATDA